MAIPDYQTVMLPLLSAAADGNEHRMREAIKSLADQFQLTDTERAELLPSGNVVFDNRVHWARTYLKKAGLIESPRWGYFQVTEQGKAALAKKPATIDLDFLKQYPEFVEYYTGKKATDEGQIQEPQRVDNETPEELLASGYLKLRKQLEFDLLSRVKSSPPDFFERLVVRLLTSMGYGGSLADAGKALGKAGDGGVDGVIKEDKLGLSLIYIQAKRWDNASVGRPEIQKFVGALHGKRARKGIFLSTSTFTKDARDYAEGLETKVILIDGAQVAELMFDYGVGVSLESTYQVKRLDSDFFEDEIGSETLVQAAAK